MVSPAGRRRAAHRGTQYPSSLTSNARVEPSRASPRLPPDRHGRTTASTRGWWRSPCRSRSRGWSACRLPSVQHRRPSFAARSLPPGSGGGPFRSKGAEGSLSGVVGARQVIEEPIEPPWDEADRVDADVGVKVAVEVNAAIRNPAERSVCQRDRRVGGAGRGRDLVAETHILEGGALGEVVVAEDQEAASRTVPQTARRGLRPRTRDGCATSPRHTMVSPGETLLVQASSMRPSIARRLGNGRPVASNAHVSAGGASMLRTGPPFWRPCPETQLREDQSDLTHWTQGDRKTRFEQTAERHAGLSKHGCRTRSTGSSTASLTTAGCVRRRRVAVEVRPG